MYPPPHMTHIATASERDRVGGREKRGKGVNEGGTERMGRGGGWGVGGGEGREERERERARERERDERGRRAKGEAGGGDGRERQFANGQLALRSHEIEHVCMNVYLFVCMYSSMYEDTCVPR